MRFHSLCMATITLGCLQASAHNGRLVSFEQVNTLNKCESLLVGEPVMTNAVTAVDRFVALTQLGLKNISVSDPQVLANIMNALQSSTPINPFLNLSSYASAAWAGQVESVLNTFDSSDWQSAIAILRPILNDRWSQQAQRNADVFETSELNRFLFMPFQYIAATLEHGLAGNPKIVRGTLLGQTAKGHYIIKFHSESSSKIYGVASIANYPESDGYPQIRWMSRNVMMVGTKAFDRLPPDQQWLSGSAFLDRTWVVDGGLYTELRPKDGASGSFVLVELDPETSSIVQTQVPPENEMFEHFRIAGGQIAAVLFGDDPTGENFRVVKGLYRFDTKTKKFSRTSLNIKSLRLCRVSGGCASGTEFIVGNNGKSRFDFENAYMKSDSLNARPDKLPWSMTEVVRPTIETVGLKSYLRLSVNAEYVPAPKKVDKSRKKLRAPPERTISIEISDTEKRKIEVSGAYGLRWNMIHRIGTSGPGEFWLVDRFTFETVKIESPEERVLQVTKVSGERFESWKVSSSNQGQFVLMGLNHMDGRVLTFRFNPERLRFENPKLGYLPDEKMDDELFLSEDRQSVVGKNTSSGIWLQMRGRLNREVEL